MLNNLNSIFDSYQSLSEQQHNIIVPSRNLEDLKKTFQNSLPTNSFSPILIETLNDISNDCCLILNSKLNNDEIEEENELIPSENSEFEVQRKIQNRPKKKIQYSKQIENANVLKYKTISNVKIIDHSKTTMVAEEKDVVDSKNLLVSSTTKQENIENKIILKNETISNRKQLYDVIESETKLLEKISKSKNNNEIEKQSLNSTTKINTMLNTLKKTDSDLILKIEKVLFFIFGFFNFFF